MMNKKSGLVHSMIVTLIVLAALSVGCSSGPKTSKQAVSSPIPEGQSQIILPETVTIKSINGQRNQMGKGLFGGDVGKSQTFNIPSGNNTLVIDYKHGTGKGNFFAWGIELRHNFLPGKTYAVVGEAKWSSGGYSIKGQGVRLYIVDAADNSLLYIKNTEKTYPTDITYSPDGSKIAFCIGKNIYVHSSVDGKLISKLSGHGKGVTSIRFNSTGNRLFSSSEDKTIRVWDINGSHAPSTLITTAKLPQFIAWSIDNNFVAIAHNNQILVYDTASGQIITTFTGYSKISNFINISFSPDSNRILSINSVPGFATVKAEAILWEAQTGRQIAKAEFNYPVMGISWHPKRNQIALSHTGQHIDHEGTIQIIDDTLKTNASYKLFPEFYNSSYYYCKWSPKLYMKPDGTELLFIADGTSVSRTTTINVFNTENGNVIRTLTSQFAESSPYHAAYSPDGRHIAFLSNDGIRVWNSDFNK